MKSTILAMYSKNLVFLCFCHVFFLPEIQSETEPLNEVTTQAMLGTLKGLFNIYASFNDRWAAAGYKDLDNKPRVTLDLFKSWAKSCIEFAIFKCEERKVYDNAESKKTLKNAINTHFTEVNKLVDPDKAPIKSILDKELKRLG